MPRPGDWDAIGLGSDPTPGDPEKISALAEGFQKMGSKAREIITAIEAVMNKNDDSVFVGQTAEALRGKVDKRLRGHVESVASAFESSATALREWRGVVVEQQGKADAALNAGRGLAEDDPERDNQKNAAKAAGDYQSDQASSYAGRINGVSDIKMPISDCEAFWEAFKWLAIILIIPALIFGGPIALIALGVNLALFIKTIVDVAKGDASFLDLFLAGLGLIAPTTKALPIFSIIKAAGKGLAAGVKGIAQTFKTVFNKDFLFSGLLAGLKAMPMLANIAIKETGLFVVKNLRNFPIVAANFGNNFGKITLGAFSKLTTTIGQLPAALGKGFSFVGKGLGTFLVGTGQFLKAHFGGLQWTRIFLPVAADEIRAFKALKMTNFQAFTQALKVGVVGRGVFAKDVFGLPMTGAISKGISSIPIDTGAGAGIGKTGFLHNLIHPDIRMPIINLQHIGNASGAGFNAGHAVTAIDDINVHLGAVKNGELGASVAPPTPINVGNIHLPGNAGTHIPDVQVATNIPSPHVGTPQISENVLGGLTPTQVGQPVLPIHLATGATPAQVHIENPHIGTNGVVANIPTPHVGTAEFGNSMHLNNVTVQSQALNNLGSLHVPNPSSNSAGLSDLAGPAIRNNTPIVPQHFGTSIGEGAAHGFQTNHFKLTIDQVLTPPAGIHLNGVQALNPPAVDRINAALDLVHNPGATTQGVTPPAIHTAKPAGTDVNVNVHLAGGDLKTPAPTTIKVDNPGLAGAQNLPTVPTVNVHSVLPETSLVPVHPLPTPSAHNLGAQNLGTHNPGVQNLGTHNPGPHNPGYSLANGTDISHAGIGTNTIASKTDIPLPGLTDRPGAYVTVERTEGGVSSFSLYGGGPDGRMHVLPGGNLRFTDVVTGNTTRFDSGGVVIDQGLRLTKADGVLRPGDQILIARPGGEFRVTTLTGDVAPDIKVSQLDNGGIRLVDEKGATFHYNGQGKLENQPLIAAADKDLTANAGVFRQPGDTDAMVNAKMGDFGQVQRAESHFDNARLDSLQERPRLPGGVSRSFDLPGGSGMKVELNGGQISFSGPKADAFGSSVNGRTLTITETGAAGTTAHTWTYSLGFGGRANQIGESFPLNGGLFDGQPLNLHGTLGNFDKAMVTDLHGNQLPVKLTDDGFVVPSAQGPMAYNKAGGFHAVEVSTAGHLPKPVPPAHLAGEDLIRWNAQADISRTHLTVAAENKTVDLLMKDVAGGSFTSKRGFEGYVNPQALKDGTLVAKVHTFENVAKDLAFKGPEDNLTLYRGVSMDPASAKAASFTERLPISTSTTMKFQDDWAKNGVNSNRVVFEIEVPPGHSKLAMSYPEGYKPVKGDAPAVNPDQFEVTLAPTTLVRNGEIRTLDNGITVIPVKAEQIPPSLYESVITAKWPGLSSETAFKDFVKSFELSNLKQFPDLENVTAKSVLSSDNLTNTVTVSKTGYADDLTITVMRDPKADSVRVTIASDGVNKFDQTWSKTDFTHIATDLRGGVLHNNEQFMNLPQPARWAEDATPAVHVDVKGKAKALDQTLDNDRAALNQAWDNDRAALNQAWDNDRAALNEAWGDDLAAKADVFRKPGDTDAIVHARMNDFGRIEHAQGNVRAALGDIGTHGHRLDGASIRPEIGAQAHLELRAAEADLSAAKLSFEGKHGLSVDNIQRQLDKLMVDSLKERPRLPGAGMRRPMPIPDSDAMFKIEGNTVDFTGDLADDFRAVLDGRALTITKVDAEGNVLRTLSYELNDLGWPMLKTDPVVLRGGDAIDSLAAKVAEPISSPPPRLAGVGRSFEVPGGGVSFQLEGTAVNFTGTRAGEFTGAINGREISVTQLGADGETLATWSFRRGIGRPNLTGRTFHLAGGPLDGEIVNLRGLMGQLDGTVGDGGVWPMRTVADDLIIGTPEGPLRYGRGGDFIESVATDTVHLPELTLPTNLHGRADHWLNQADLSRTHLSAATTDKTVEHLMKDVIGGSFTSKRGFGGYVKPLALEDGTLVSKTQDFVNTTRDLLLKGPDQEIRLYRGVSMDPISAEANRFVDRLPSSTSNNLAFQAEWAKNGAAGNRFVFEIEVPAGHGKLAMSYPPGYQAGLDEARAWNQSQWEVTLAPTTLVRTGPDRVVDGMTIIPVRAEQIPVGQLADLIRETPPPMPLQTAFDDFVGSFDQGAINRWEGFDDVSVTKTTSVDGNLTTITATKPGYAETLSIQIGKDVDASTVSVKIDGGTTTFDKGWKNTDLGDLGAQLRGKVLNDSDLFLRLPQPGSWANEPIVVNMMLQGLPGGAHVRVGNTGGRATHELVNGPVGGQLEHLPNGGFRVTEGNRSWGFDGEGVRLDHQFQLTGTNNAHTLVHPVDGRPHFEGPNPHLLSVQDLGDGGFRVNGAHGHTQRYGADGVHIADGLALTDRQSLRGVLFTEPNGAGGFHVVDVHGSPIPNTHVTQLPNGQTMVVDGAMRDVQWFARDGVRQSIGVQVAHADFPNPVYLYRTEGGNLSFVDHLGAHLPEQVTVVPGGFRITDPGTGIARTFDDAGAAIDRRIRLHQPGVQPRQQLIVVHDVHGNVNLRNGADAPGPGTVELTAGGGYRAIDNGNYHVYDADGAHQAHGVAVTLPGENGFLEIGAHGAQRVDGAYQPLTTHQVNFNAAAGEITVIRAGGHDVFNLQGVVVREVTDLDPLGASQLGGRITRDNNTGAVTWTDANGVQMAMPHRVTIDAQGNLKVEIQLNGSPRNGEYHQYSRGGQLTEQGFPVLNGNQQTQYTYVVDRANSTWTRTGGTGADGVFQSGKVEVTGVGNGQLKLISSSAKEVQVFERRWLPSGEIMDSFRKTDTLGFGTFNRRTTWATYDNAGGISNWGKREFDTSGFSWRDVDHNGNAIHHYQQGLQKYDNPIADQIGPMGKAEKEITGHVLAAKGADGNWTWHRFDADGALVGSGQRTWEKLGDGFTDRVTLQVNGNNTTEIAQQKWGNWHGTSKANQYQEFKLDTGAGGLERPGNWEVQGKAGKPIGSGTKLPNDNILSAVRVGEQRPPVWFRDYVQRNPVPEGNVSHVANDARYQVYRWETTGATNPGHGVRYVAGDESFVDVGLDGRFVRFEGKLHDGAKLKVGDQVEPPAVPHTQANAMAWEADDVRGWRLFDDTNNSWEDVVRPHGPRPQGQVGDNWVVVRQSRPGGEVREFPELGNRNVWIQRDAHGNLVGSSHQIPPYGHNPPVRYIESTGAADRSNWTWRELDQNGVPTGVTGDRFHFKGSRDESISWDNSFRDVDARGNLVRDRHMLDEGRYVESWRSNNGNWHSAEFDKLGQRVDGAMTFDRRWGNGNGQWSPNWSAGSTQIKDSTPGTAPVPRQARFETPQHIGDGRPARVREYHVDAAGNADRGQWKEFDFDKIVRERAASGVNYLETDKLHGQWKLWDNTGAVIGERSETGLVFEMRGGRLTLTGNEFDFRGSMTEFRGWNARIGDAQRQPWLMHSDWTFDPKTLRPQGDPLRIEANYASYGRLLTQKMLLTAGTEFVLDYAAGLIILAIIADAQNKPFTGTDALKALMNAAVGTALRTVAGAALTETRLGGGLRDLKTSMGNLDGGTLITKRPNNNSAQWGVEWAGNTSVTKWRGGTFDYGFGMLMLPLTGFVNGTMNAAIFGVKGPDGKTVKLTGWQAMAEGGMSVATGYAIANSIGMLRTLGMGFGAGRFFQKGGIADIGIGFGLKFFEKGMASLLAPALRQSMNPEWSRPAPQPIILPPGVTVPQPQVTSSGLVLPPGVQMPAASAPQTGTP